MRTLARLLLCLTLLLVSACSPADDADAPVGVDRAEENGAGAGAGDAGDAGDGEDAAADDAQEGASGADDSDGSGAEADDAPLPESERAFVVPTFRELDWDAEHEWEDDTVFPFVGAGVIDVDGDGLDELFVGGSQDQADALWRYVDSSLVDVIDGTGLSDQAATYGVLVIDDDEDGDDDLYVARETGLSRYENDGAGVFTASEIPLSLEPDTVPVAVAGADIEGDGDLDLYVSTFIDNERFVAAQFNNEEHAKANVLLVGDGAGGFTDATADSGALVDQNSFHASFLDLDGDGDAELAVAQNTGTVALFDNRGDGTFAALPTASDNGFWMGFAADDYDADGDIDLFFSNVGTSIPNRLLRGDLRDDQTVSMEWLLLRNEGDLHFTDATVDENLHEYPFAWGAAFADWNLDGLPDLSVVENYLKWPAHRLRKSPGRLLLRTSEGAFRLVTEEAKAENPAYGGTPVDIDWNGDGAPDLAYINQADEHKALLNEGVPHDYLKVRLPNTPAAIGAHVEVTTRSGRTIGKQRFHNQGLMSDLSSDLTFGLWDNDPPVLLRVTYPGGGVVEITELAANSTVEVE